MRDIAYLKLLAREYPTIQSASTEIINLTAIQGLPKGTEYFFSDLHGEHEAFIHLLRSSSGIIREKIKETFGYVIPEDEQDELANLIYYPKRTLNQLAQSDSDHNNDDWKRITIYRLVQLCKQVSSKYTRSKVRKKLPPDFAYVIDELLHVDYNADNKKVYYSEIVQTIIDIGSADQFICVLCELIQNLTIDNLHIIGDIFDRGPRADLILNELMNFHDVDIQWEIMISPGWERQLATWPVCVMCCGSPSVITALMCWKMVMELICARFRCLRPLHTGMTRVPGLNHIFWTRISMTW